MTRFTRSLGGPATKECAYSFRTTDEGLLTSFSSSNPAFSPPETGFVEGLWGFDCGEIFLYQPLSGRYLEINVSPNGAWWSCVFSGVRSRDEDADPPQIELISFVQSPESWSCSFVLPWVEVTRCLGATDNLQGNVTLILGGCPDIDPPVENLHSVAELGAVDFHRPHEWLPLERLLN